MTRPLGLWDALYRLEAACEALGAARATQRPTDVAEAAVATSRARVSALLTVLESRQSSEQKAVKRPGVAES